MRLYNFTLRQMQYAIAVADLGSFRRAAERCHVSQPSLSVQIRGIETALGVRLFERDRRGALVTRAGKGVIERMRRVLLETEDVVGTARRFVDPLAGTLRIGAIPTIGPYLLPKASLALREEHPQLSLEWLEDKTEALLRRIGQGELDGALLALEAGIGELESETIDRDPFVLATPPGHPLAEGPGPVPFRKLRSEPVLLLDDGHCLRDQIIEFCAGGGVRDLSVRATSLPTLVQMVGAGMGVTLLPEIAAPTETLRSELRIRPLRAPEPHRTVVLAFRGRSAVGGAMREVARTIRKTVRAG